MRRETKNIYKLWPVKNSFQQKRELVYRDILLQIISYHSNIIMVKFPSDGRIEAKGDPASEHRKSLLDTVDDIIAVAVTRGVVR